MAKYLTFTEDFQSVTVICNGVPLSLKADVTVTIVRPAKLDIPSRRAWDQLTQKSAQYVTAELVPGDGADGK